MNSFASFTQRDVTKTREAAKAYFAVGWQPLPIVAGGKHPKIKNWRTDLVSSEADLDVRFKPGDGVGVALGAASNNLGDIDFDHTLAAQAGALLVEAGAFPDGLTFGRKSMPASHRLFHGDGPIKPQNYSLPQKIADGIGLANEKAEKGGVLFVEVRGDGAQTVFPPSRHGSGETRLWENITDLPDVRVVEVYRFAALSAFLAVVLHCYGNASSRNDLCLALTGLLVRCGFDVATADSIVLAIAKECKDEEASKRLSGVRAAQRFEAGKPISGLHTVCELLGLLEAKKVFARWLFGQSLALEDDGEPPSDGRPVLVLNPGKKREAALEAITALKTARVELFLRAGQLVRVGRNETTQTRGRSNSFATVPTIEPVDHRWLQAKLMEVAHWRRPLGGRLAPADPDGEFARFVMAVAKDGLFPPLLGVIQTPTLRGDFSVLQQPGYDAQSALFLDPGQTAFPEVPASPTRADAMCALGLMGNILRGFPFEPADVAEDWQPGKDEGLNPSHSRSVVLSAWLTGMIRRTLRTAPLHAIDAPEKGSGKSLLADIIAIIVTGTTAQVVSWSFRPEENDKKLFAALLAGDAALFIDNVEKPIEGDVICSLLSQDQMRSRILGESRNVTVPTNVLVMATGNNLVFVGDVSRRAVMCRLNAREGRPDKRKFDFDARELAREQRVDLVVGALTILRGYIAAGRPCRDKVTRVGSFEQWSIVQEALVWLDQPDPAETLERALASDPEAEALAEVMSAWGLCFGDKEVCIRDAYDIARFGENRQGDGPEKRLHEAFEHIANGRHLSTRGLGKWFAKRLGKVINGKRFELAGKDGHDSNLYRLVGETRQPAINVAMFQGGQRIV